MFVDPIDGTREFARGQGDYGTILIGYNDSSLRDFLMKFY
jgi:3'-phosphoadenosine 5'-phosphosulfate (PAPS) 3'-phosphatase